MFISKDQVDEKRKALQSIWDKKNLPQTQKMHHIVPVSSGVVRAARLTNLQDQDYVTHSISSSPDDVQDETIEPLVPQDSSNDNHGRDDDGSDDVDVEAIQKWKFVLIQVPSELGPARRYVGEITHKSEVNDAFPLTVQFLTKNDHDGRVFIYKDESNSNISTSQVIRILPDPKTVNNRGIKVHFPEPVQVF